MPASIVSASSLMNTRPSANPPPLHTPLKFVNSTEILYKTNCFTLDLGQDLCCEIFLGKIQNKEQLTKASSIKKDKFRNISKRNSCE